MYKRYDELSGFPASHIYDISLTLWEIFSLKFISQEKMSKKYDEESSQYTQQIENARTTQNKLKATSSSLNTINYIEDTARNKLDMYLPNERVYVDIDN